MNHIDAVRADLQRMLTTGVWVPGSEEVIVSPSGRFQLKTANVSVPNELPNWLLTKAEVFRAESVEAIFSFLINDDRGFFSWAEARGSEYLISAEDLFGGQSIFNLTNGTKAGYSPGEDGFIWTDHYASPDGKTLAVIGCFWACPFVIKLLDFTNPMTLPLPEIREIDLLDNDEIILNWIDDTSFRTKGIKRKREWGDNGEGLLVIEEIPMERTIYLDGRIVEQVI